MLTLNKSIQSYQVARKALKDLLFKSLKDENSEYAGDRAEVYPMRPNSDTYIALIAELDGLLTDARSLSDHLERWEGQDGVLKGINEIEQSKIENYIEDVFNSNELDDDGKDLWQERLKKCDRFISIITELEKEYLVNLMIKHDVKPEWANARNGNELSKRTIISLIYQGYTSAEQIKIDYEKGKEFTRELNFGPKCLSELEEWIGI